MSSYSSLIILYHFMTDIQLFIFVTAKYIPTGQILTNWGYKNFKKQNLDKLMFTELLEEILLNSKFVIFLIKILCYTVS